MPTSSVVAGGDREVEHLSESLSWGHGRGLNGVAAPVDENTVPHSRKKSSLGSSKLFVQERLARPQEGVYKAVRKGGPAVRGL